MSLDGFIAGPGHAMNWGSARIADFVAPDDIEEIAAATGAMLIGRADQRSRREDGGRRARQRRTTRSRVSSSS